MSLITRYRIVHTDRTDSSSVDLVEAFNMDTDEGIKANMDSFQFRILVGVKPVRTLELNDGIDIYFGKGSGDPTGLIINGIITEFSYDMGVDGLVLTVRGVNRYERMLFSPSVAVFAIDYAYTGVRDSTARTGWGAIITNLVDRANEFKSEDDPTNITYDITSIPDLGNLPKEYNSDWRSVFEHLERLATPDWTPDGNEYFIELDTSNKLHFRNKASSTYSNPTGTIDLDGENVQSAKVKFGVSEVINAVLLNCGKDTAGNSILVTMYDSTSMNLYGSKFKYIKREEIANQYNKENSGASVDTQREDIKDLGKRYARGIVRILGQARYKIDIDFMIGNLNFTKGKVYKVRSSEITILGTTEPLTQLRLTNILHRFSARNGWTTRLRLEQDEQTILASG